jgi:hypothetical protein
MKLKLMEGKALAKLIGSIGTARVQLDEQVQVACVQVIGQSIVHRNTTPANSLLDAVSKHHKATVVVYLEKFGNLAWDRKADKLAFREVHQAAELEKAIDAIGDAKWYDAKKPPKVVSQYDAAEMIAELFDRLRKAAKKGIAITNAPVLREVEAAYNAAMVKAYGEGNKSAQQLAIDGALDARTKGLATPTQLAMLAEHFGKPVTQFKETPSALAEAAIEEAKQFGALPTLVAAQ